MTGFVFEHCLTHCARAVALDALIRTSKMGALADDHHFYLTFQTDFPGVELPSGAFGNVDNEMTVVLQHRFEDLVVEAETIAVTLYFNGLPARIRVPAFALTQFLDPSVQFTLDFPRCTPEDLEGLLPPFRFASALVGLLTPLSRMEYAAKGDRVFRAISAWLVGSIAEGEADDIIAELEVDTRFPGLKIIEGTPIPDRWTVRIDSSIEEARITDTAISFPQEGLQKTIPLGALRTVTIVDADGRRPLELGEAAPLDRTVAPLTIVSTLRANANRALRAVMIHALETAQLLRRLPFGHHFYLTFATQFPGVELPERIAAQYPTTMTVVLQHSYRNLVCGHDAISVTLSFSGEEADLRIPYLAVTSFSDPEVSREWSFGHSDADDALSANILADAREQIGPAEKQDWIDYTWLEQRAQRVTIATALSELATGRRLASDQSYRMRLDRTLSDLPKALEQTIDAEGALIELRLDDSAYDCFSTPDTMGWRDPRSGLLLELPYDTIREFTAIAGADEHSILLPAPAGGTAMLARAAEPAHIRLAQRYISKQGHLVHKLKAKDTTGLWAYYFILVTQAREREFLSAIESDGTIDLEDFGKVLASCYGEQPTEETKRYLFELYGFDV